MARWGGRARYKDWDQQVMRQRVEEDSRTLGAGLAGHLVGALRQRSVPILLNTPVRALILANGGVEGVLVSQEGRDLKVRARRGVILATGSYSGASELGRRFEELREGDSVVPPSVDGDGLVIAAEIGAAAARRETFQRQLVYSIPGEMHEGAPAQRAAGNNEVGFPHCMVVNIDGERFADESIGQQFGQAFRSFDSIRHRYVNIPCFLIFDQTYMDNYGFGNIRPGQQPPEGWPLRSRSVSGLAGKLGIDPQRLSRAVRRFNRYAREGKDPDYGRGSFPFANAVSGDLAHKPNPSLGPLEKPPFYGVPLMPSGSGSVGLVTDRFARVLHVRGHHIPKLYAVGTAAAGFYGVGYQAGCQLGGAMTFAYIAVRHALGRE
jgi:3-oxosteroid 1-dehydrogenase